MKNPIIELKNINMVFYKTGRFMHQERKFHVLKNLNLSISEGEIIAVVGESGCGKTTVGKIITGLLKPTSGEVYYKGENVYKLFSVGNKEFKESVQFIQQDSYAALNPVKTIYQSLYAPIKSRNKKLSSREIDDLIEKYLEIVGMKPANQYLNKYPHQLSGGQRQRVLMARAISLKPKIIVADEPVSMIDVSLRLSILNLMDVLNKEFKIAFVYITHDLATARYIANNGRIAVMYLGEIIEIASVNELLAHPKHPYTQALLASVPIPDPVIARKDNVIPIKSMDLMSLENRLHGCSFYPRCLYGEKSCEVGNVEYKDFSGHLVKCLYPQSSNRKDDL